MQVQRQQRQPKHVHLPKPFPLHPAYLFHARPSVSATVSHSRTPSEKLSFVPPPPLPPPLLFSAQPTKNKNHSTPRTANPNLVTHGKPLSSAVASYSPSRPATPSRSASAGSAGLTPTSTMSVITGEKLCRCLE